MSGVFFNYQPNKQNATQIKQRYCKRKRKKKNKFSDKYATLSRCNLLETCRLDRKRTTLQKMWQTNKIKFMNIEELFRLAFLCTFAA